ncbi:MAG: 16S rRNA processing protein RimM [Ruminococcaceae bacterium]|nr:16S rRNA processing protein RimM [Oscillospiraceae bacterium]
MIQQYLEAGTIVTTHGVHGEVKILPWADGPEFLTLFDRVFLQGKEYAVENARVQKTCVLMKLRGVDTVEAAQALRDQVVRVDRNDVELEEGTYFISDLIGLKVLCDDEELGVVKEIMTLPGNDVYVVKGEHEYMIPGVKEFIKEVDPAAGFIRVKIIEGMRTDAD